ncbi:hypothetical protein [Lihuaxuella thermophila]|uniref:Uncharacterized protein n=1 Tax=Lihuaxuella thermophila TaxID=1173111 RepID=A0A1H8IIB4_9BACL|nr:hypothetical protein [Lihuaxuella thermophila]SEN67458.1 hypothetical protein SAMN05444955_11771 [Lihuaxuella thermophila]
MLPISALCVGLMGVLAFKWLDFSGYSILGNLIFYLGFVFAGLLNFFIGKSINTPDAEEESSLFFIPMEIWGLLLPGIGLYVVLPGMLEGISKGIWI